MSRRWYNREKARETIRMAMDSAPRRHHPRVEVRDEDAALPAVTEDEERLPAAVRDQRTMEQIRELASETPDVMRSLLRSVKTPAMAKIRLIEIILDRTFGKAEATVNVNSTTRSVEASETRIEALIRAIRVENGEE